MIKSRSENKKEAGKLPSKIPTLVIPGAIILPDALLTINASDAHEKEVIDLAFQTKRIIGVLQPRDQVAGSTGASFFAIGGAGRITSFTETDEGNYLIGITGLCRFKLKDAELQNNKKALHEVDWSSFHADLNPPEEIEPIINRDKLSNAITSCFKNEGIVPDWNSLQLASDESLISILSVACPFSVTEKQALLECITLKERAELLLALLEMSIHKTDVEGRRH